MLGRPLSQRAAHCGYVRMTHECVQSCRYDFLFGSGFGSCRAAYCAAAQMHEMPVIRIPVGA